PGYFFPAKCLNRLFMQRERIADTRVNIDFAIGFQVRFGTLQKVEVRFWHVVRIASVRFNRFRAPHAPPEVQISVGQATEYGEHHSIVIPHYQSHITALAPLEQYFDNARSIGTTVADIPQKSDLVIRGRGEGMEHERERDIAAMNVADGEESSSRH